MPTRESMERSRFMKPFAARVLRSELWRFTRRSVPRGVALGMLVGIVVPLGQIFVAALLALPVRANVPVAALTTFITNPITTPIFWIVAYQVGKFILRIDATTFGQPVATALNTPEVDSWMQWLTGAASITAVGLVVMGVVLAALSYVLSAFGWRIWIANKRRRRISKAKRSAHSVS
ncbi:DUF2062 domain-containing protein [Blastomonas sp.]|uniref:DUF2062 domain-containing protein n=1 Tax=Blastomonas sp. TaxID=1909299 RepID=UPI0035930C7B